MTTDDLIKHFGSGPKAYHALGVSVQLWHVWCRNGVPLSRQFLIQKQTKGALSIGEKKPGKRFRSRVVA